MIAYPHCGFESVCGVAVELCHFSLDIISNVGYDSSTIASFFFTSAGVLWISSDFCGTTEVQCFLEKGYVDL